MKKVLATILSLVMVFTILPMAVINASADADWPPEVVATVTGEDEITVTTQEESCVYVKFTPSIDSYYSITSESESDPQGTLYDTSEEKLTYNDDSIGYDFVLCYEFEAGKDYYLEVYNYSDGENEVKLIFKQEDHNITDDGDDDDDYDYDDYDYDDDDYFEDGYYSYKVADGEATITGCDEDISGNITIPSELGGCPVTKIDKWAFSYRESLTSITIPDSVTSIGDGVFSGCTSLTSVVVSENNNCYASIDGVLFDKNKTEIICYPAGKTDKSYSIPDSVSSVGNYVFAYCTSLTSVTIPSSVTSIGERAFSFCSSLTSVTIPDSVTSIGEEAFYCCESLTSATIGNGVTSISGSIFYENTSLTSVTIGNSVTSIGDGAFEHCTSLTSVTIPDSVTSIGDGVFFDCTSLTSVTIPDSVTSIGDGAFEHCTSLTSITIPWAQ